MISVIIPTYNHATSVAKTINSVLNQSEKDTEIIVINDGSKDNTIQVLKQFANNTKIKIINQKNQGSNPARNNGAEQAKGEYLIFLDADAILTKTALQQLKEKLQNSNAAYAYADFKFGHRHFKTGKFNSEKLKRMNYIHTSSLIKTEKFPGFDNKIKRFQDWDLWLTMLKNGDEGVYIPGELMSITVEYAGLSSWIPRAWYKNPWKQLPFIKQKVKKYEQAKIIIRQKHRI